MQVPTLVLAVAVEIYLALLVAAVVLIFHALKQKKLIRRQQEKLRELIETIKTTNSPAAPTGKSYKQLINEQRELTLDRFVLIAPRSDINEVQSTELPINQRIVALRYAFLRAEQLGTAEVPGSEGYWNVFRQSLEPFLQPAIDNTLDTSLETSSNEELEMYKK